jgi:sugar/nucleoside kinase (ribokinase family)
VAARFDLICVGEAFEDLIFYGLPRLPRLGEELKTGSFVRTLGGGAVITCVAAARLGLRTSLVSGLAPSVARTLRGEGIVVRNLRRAGEDGALSVALGTRGERSFVTFTGSNAAVESRLLAYLDRTPPARHVHLALCPTSCARWIPVLARLRRRGVTTSWDFGWSEALPRDRAFHALVSELEFLSVNAKEARHYAGASTMDRAMTFWSRHARQVLIRRGADGCSWIRGSERAHARAPKVRAIETTGAGDAWNGGFLAGFLEGRPIADCLRLANEVGAASTQAPGGLDGVPRKRRPKVQLRC